MTNPQGWVNPIGPGAGPSRIDMGVDYTGKFKLLAMGSGVITNLYNSGWPPYGPGAAFIGLKLDTGQYMYYAENIAVQPGLQVGQRVTAGQQLGTARGPYPYTEIGWAAPPGTGGTMAAQMGEAAPGGDPGAKSTAYGVSMSNTIAALGGPAGILTPGGITGTVTPGYTQGGTANTTSANAPAASSPLSGCVPFIWIAWWFYCLIKKVIHYQAA